MTNKYRLLSYHMQEEFVQKVNALMAEGWEPQGGVSVAINSANERLFFQAMIWSPKNKNT